MGRWGVCVRLLSWKAEPRRFYRRIKETSRKPQDPLNDVSGSGVAGRCGSSPTKGMNNISSY